MWYKAHIPSWGRLRTVANRQNPLSLRERVRVREIHQQGGIVMRTSTSLRWLVVTVSAAMLLAVAAACGSETIEVPGETVVVEKVVTETVEVPGETVVVEKEVIRTVEVPGETVTKEVVKEVMVPGETVVVEKEVIKTVEVVKSVPVEVIKEVEVVGDRYARNTLGKVVLKPQYGGTIVGSEDGEPRAFRDPLTAGDNWLVGPVYDTLWGPDWASGPAGTGEWQGGATAWGARVDPNKIEELTTGRVAESWEQPDPETTIFHLKKGVYFHDRPPVNGREVVAADVAYSYSRYFGLGYAGFNEKQGERCEDTVLTAHLISVDAPDKYTVVFKHKPSSMLMTRFFLSIFNCDYVYAREAVEQEGGYNDYDTMVGTGPFMLDDYVRESSFTYVRNPNYWAYDALHPENQLPYLDELKYIMIPDEVTLVAALRAGKLSTMYVFDWVQLEELKESHPYLNTAPMEKEAVSIAIANNAEPLTDIRVRQALMMAINTDELITEFYGGYAGDELTPYIATPGLYTPMDELPQELQDVYTYNPVGAKQLLADAGYSEGDVEFTIYGGAAQSGFGELLLLVNDYFADIGVNAPIKQIEGGALFGMMWSEDKTLFDGVSKQASGYFPSPTDVGFRVEDFYSKAVTPFHVNDPHYDAMHKRLTEQLEAGSAEWNALIKEMNDYAFTQTWFLPLPSAPLFSIWQPWFHNYVPGWGLLFSFSDMSLAHFWIDQDLQREMGH